MLEREITVTLSGRPAPKGSLRCVTPHVGRRRSMLVEQLDKVAKPWRTEVVRAMRTAIRRTHAHADPEQAVGVEVTLTVQRPRTVDRTHPTTARGSGDVDKLARLVLDALQDSTLIPNDAAVVELTARKQYPGGPLPDTLDYPGAVIRVYPIGD